MKIICHIIFSILITCSRIKETFAFQANQSKYKTVNDEEILSPVKDESIKHPIKIFYATLSKDSNLDEDALSGYLEEDRGRMKSVPDLLKEKEKDNQRHDMDAAMRRRYGAIFDRYDQDLFRYTSHPDGGPKTKHRSQPKYPQCEEETVVTMETVLATMNEREKQRMMFSESEYTTEQGIRGSEDRSTGHGVSSSTNRAPNNKYESFLPVVTNNYYYITYPREPNNQEMKNRVLTSKNQNRKFNSYSNDTDDVEYYLTVKKVPTVYPVLLNMNEEVNKAFRTSLQNGRLLVNGTTPLSLYQVKEVTPVSRKVPPSPGIVHTRKLSAEELCGDLTRIKLKFDIPTKKTAKGQRNKFPQHKSEILQEDEAEKVKKIFDVHNNENGIVLLECDHNVENVPQDKFDTNCTVLANRSFHLPEKQYLMMHDCEMDNLMTTDHGHIDEITYIAENNEANNHRDRRSAKILSTINGNQSSIEPSNIVKLMNIIQEEFQTIKRRSPTKFEGSDEYSQKFQNLHKDLMELQNCLLSQGKTGGGARLDETEKNLTLQIRVVVDVINNNQSSTRTRSVEPEEDTLHKRDTALKNIFNLGSEFVNGSSEWSGDLSPVMFDHDSPLTEDQAWDSRGNSDRSPERNLSPEWKLASNMTGSHVNSNTVPRREVGSGSAAHIGIGSGSAELRGGVGSDDRCCPTEVLLKNITAIVDSLLESYTARKNSDQNFTGDGARKMKRSAERKMSQYGYLFREKQVNPATLNPVDLVNAQFYNQEGASGTEDPLCRLVTFQSRPGGNNQTSVTEDAVLMNDTWCRVDLKTQRNKTHTPFKISKKSVDQTGATEGFIESTDTITGNNSISKRKYDSMVDDNLKYLQYIVEHYKQSKFKLKKSILPLDVERRKNKDFKNKNVLSPSSLSVTSSEELGSTEVIKSSLPSNISVDSKVLDKGFIKSITDHGLDIEEINYSGNFHKYRNKHPSGMGLFEEVGGINEKLKGGEDSEKPVVEVKWCCKPEPLPPPTPPPECKAYGAEFMNRMKVSKKNRWRQSKRRKTRKVLHGPPVVHENTSAENQPEKQSTRNGKHRKYRTPTLLTTRSNPVTEEATEPYESSEDMSNYVNGAATEDEELGTSEEVEGETGVEGKELGKKGGQLNGVDFEQFYDDPYRCTNGALGRVKNNEDESDNYDNEDVGCETTTKSECNTTLCCETSEDEDRNQEGVTMEAKCQTCQPECTRNKCMTTCKCKCTTACKTTMCRKPTKCKTTCPPKCTTKCCPEPICDECETTCPPICAKTCKTKCTPRRFSGSCSERPKKCYTKCTKKWLPHPTRGPKCPQMHSVPYCTRAPKCTKSPCCTTKRPKCTTMCKPKLPCCEQSTRCCPTPKSCCSGCCPSQRPCAYHPTDWFTPFPRNKTQPPYFKHLREQATQLPPPPSETTPKRRGLKGLFQFTKKTKTKRHSTTLRHKGFQCHHHKKNHTLPRDHGLCVWTSTRRSWKGTPWTEATPIAMSASPCPPGTTSGDLLEGYNYFKTVSNCELKKKTSIGLGLAEASTPSAVYQEND